MKKQFFSKTLIALALTCGAFAFTGCNDLEQDLNGLSERVDQLEVGKIADLEEQVATLEKALGTANTTISGLQSALNTLEETTIPGLEGRLAAVEALEGELDALQSLVDDIEAGLADYATLDYVDATFATKESVSALETELGKVDGRVDALQNDLTELEGTVGENSTAISGLQASLGTVQTDIRTLQTDLAGALGRIKSLEDALLNYATKGELQTKVDSLDQALKAELEEKLDVSEFDKKFDESLAEALSEGGVVSNAIAQAVENASKTFQASLDEVEATINALIGKVDDLANRIQSLVFVPEYADGNATVTTYRLGDAQVGDNIVTATFQVTPASLAVNLAGQMENVAAYVVPLKTRAASAPEFVASKAEGTLELSAREDVPGYVDVWMALPDEYVAGNYAFALYVASAEDVESASENPELLKDIDAGTYYVSEYVQTTADEVSFSISNYSLRSDLDQTEIGPDALTHKVPWTRVNSEEGTLVDFYAGYSLYLQLEEGGEYYTLEDAAGLMNADEAEITPNYCSSDPVYAPSWMSQNLEEYFTVADAGHPFYTDSESTYGKTVAMAKTADEMSAVAGAYVTISDKFYFGEDAETAEGLEYTTRYDIVNEPVKIRISVPEVLDWSYDFAVEHRGDDEGPANAKPVEFESVSYTVDGDLGSTTVDQIFEYVMRETAKRSATLNGEVIAEDGMPAVGFTYNETDDNVTISVDKYAFDSEVENKYEITYSYADWLTNCEVIVEYTLGTMPGEVVVPLGEADVTVFSSSSNHTQLFDEADAAYSAAFDALGAGQTWFKDLDQLKASISGSTETVAVTRTSAGTEESIDDPAWTFLRIDPYTDGKGERSNLRISGSAVKAVGDVFDFATRYETWYGVTYTFNAKRTITAPDYGFEVDPVFAPGGNVTLEYHTADGAYVLDAADPSNYLTVVGLPAGFAESLKVGFEVTCEHAAAGTVPEISVRTVDNATGNLSEGAIEWGDFRGREIVVEARLLLGDTEIEVASATLNLSAPAVVTGFEGAEGTIDRNLNDNTTIRLWEYLTATGFKAEGNFIPTVDAEDGAPFETISDVNEDASMKLYGAQISFGGLKATITSESGEELEYNGDGRAFSYDAGAGTIVVDKENATMNPIKFTVEATMKYYLDNGEPHETTTSVTISQGE